MKQRLMLKKLFKLDGINTWICIPGFLQPTYTYTHNLSNLSTKPSPLHDCFKLNLLAVRNFQNVLLSNWAIKLAAILFWSTYGEFFSPLSLSLPLSSFFHDREKYSLKRDQNCFMTELKKNKLKVPIHSSHPIFLNCVILKQQAKKLILQNIS